MSHAANLGRLEIIKAMAALGAQDFQHAFDRAMLQGRIDCARWLVKSSAGLPSAITGRRISVTSRCGSTRASTVTMSFSGGDGR
jgi:hypothetical protein